MTVIDTSTTATATAYSNQRKIDRCQNGVLWSFFWEQATSRWYSSFSTDNGATWSAKSIMYDLGGTSLTGNGSFFIDLDDYCHHVYKGSNNGVIYYRRGTPNAGRTAWTWSAALDIVEGSSGRDYADVIAHREGAGWVAHVLTSHPPATGPAIWYHRITITSAHVISEAAETNIGNNYNIAVHGYPSIDFNHTGDGKTVAGGTPHLYAAWSAGSTGAGKGIRFRKATYSGGTWTWGTEREIDANHYIENTTIRWLNCLFDGTRVIIGGFLNDNVSSVNRDLILHERDAADTTTTQRILMDNAGSTDLLHVGSMTYDNNGNVYFFGVQRTTTPFPLVYKKWDRSMSTLESAIVIDSDVGYYERWCSAKRGYFNDRIEFIYTEGTASPYSVTYGSIILNLSPNAPIVVVPEDTSVQDLANGYTFDWTFSDPDAGDTQSAWAIRRKVGAGAYEYYDAVAETWGGALVWNIGSTSQYTFPASKWDKNTTYLWSINTKDTSGAAGVFADDLTVISSGSEGWDTLFI